MKKIKYIARIRGRLGWSHRSMKPVVVVRVIIISKSPVRRKKISVRQKPRRDEKRRKPLKKRIPANGAVNYKPPRKWYEEERRRRREEFLKKINGCRRQVSGRDGGCHRIPECGYTLILHVWKKVNEMFPDISRTDRLNRNFHMQRLEMKQFKMITARARKFSPQIHRSIFGARKRKHCSIITRPRVFIVKNQNHKAFATPVLFFFLLAKNSFFSFSLYFLGGRTEQNSIRFGRPRNRKPKHFGGSRHRCWLVIGHIRLPLERVRRFYSDEPSWVSDGRKRPRWRRQWHRSARLASGTRPPVRTFRPGARHQRGCRLCTARWARSQSASRISCEGSSSRTRWTCPAAAAGAGRPPSFCSSTGAGGDHHLLHPMAAVAVVAESNSWPAAYAASGWVIRICCWI